MVLLLLTLTIAGVWLIAGAGHGLTRSHVVEAGVPLDEVHPAGGGRHPGVVVAHGFSGSATLMAPFGDTLAARGYVVVLLDFAGHGANTGPLADEAAGTAQSTQVLQHDLDVALAHLRSLPDVDPARVALVGHSMGAGAVTRYAAAHPDVTATVAISLPDSSVASAERPARLLTLAGALEFPGFRAVAADVAAQRADRAVRIVPFVEHISILYAPAAHRATVSWLDDAFGGPQNDDPIPFPGRRLAGAALLVAAFVLGLYPLARLLSGERRGWPRFDLPALARVAAVTAVAAGIGAVAARFLPTTRLPIAIAGYLVGFAAITGALLLVYGRKRRPAPGRARFALLVPYAIVAITLPLQWGMTHMLPAGHRWWLIPIVWAAFALFAYATELVAGGNALGVLTACAVLVIVLVAAAVVGLTHGFVLLAVVPLAGLMVWQSLWSAILNRFAAPAWAIALVGSVVVIWPLTAALPLVG
ncbi:dienelactone hydrolase family protein [Actinoplanes sp. L3-i22]|uniref:dienelactone hydrolase family protein n=1 Tax=Actinoplanes sp. L3-i22 TaxID=2836373 RepID=UPI002106A533|nr:alpha/beta fold hydrolase [Actinoplanes sp. L3-i22]